LTPGDKMSMALLQLRTQVKLFHWQTSSYAEHKALDWLGERLLELNDLWVEAYQGKEHTRVHCGGCRLRLHDWEPGAALIYLQERAQSVLMKRNTHWSGPEHSYLANILDEIVTALGKASFMLSLR